MYPCDRMHARSGQHERVTSQFDIEKWLRDVNKFNLRLYYGDGHRVCINTMMDSEKSYFRERLRKLCELLILHDPTNFGEEAEGILWSRVYQEPFQMLCEKKQELSVEQKFRARDLMTASMEFYYNLVRRVLRLTKGTYYEEVLSASEALRLNPLKPKDQLEQFVLDTVYKVYLHMGDITIFKSDLSINSTVHRQFSIAKSMYLKAFNLKPDDGRALRKLGLLYYNVNYSMTSIFYHLRSMLISNDVHAHQCIRNFLTENNMLYFLQLKMFGSNVPIKITYRNLKMFTIYSLHLFKYLHDDGDNWQFYVNAERLKNEYLSLLRSCFYFLRNSPSGLAKEAAEFNAETLFEFVGMLIIMVNYFEQSDSRKLDITVELLLGILEMLLEYITFDIGYLMRSDVKLKNLNNHLRALQEKEKRRLQTRKMIRNQVANASASAVQSARQGEGSAAPKAHVNEQVLHDQFYNSSANKKLYAALAEAKRTFVEHKCEILYKIQWLKPLKLFCDWLRSRSQTLTEMKKRVTQMFVYLINRLPTEEEFSNLLPTNDYVSKSLKSYFAYPAGPWEQPFYTEDDMQMYKVVKYCVKSTGEWKIVEKNTSNLLTVATLRAFGHHLVAQTALGVIYDDVQQTFLRNQQDREEKWERISNFDMNKMSMFNGYAYDIAPVRHLIAPDATAFMFQLNLIKELYTSGHFTLVITDNTLKELEVWQAGAYKSLMAISWAQNVVGMDFRNIKVARLSENDETPDRAPVKRPGLADPELDLLTACNYIMESLCSEKKTLTVLSGYCKDSDAFKYMNDVANWQLEGIFVDNIACYFKKWMEDESYD